jgi:hypothetical protein
MYYTPVKPPFKKAGDIQEGKLGIITWERCECGNRIAPFVGNLEDSNQDVKRKCVNCLIREGRMEIEQR